MRTAGDLFPPLNLLPVMFHGELRFNVWLAGGVSVLK